ncbi:MAG: hypothetical protein ACRDEB_04885, partial [Chitinophagaceae bacterium]
MIPGNANLLQSLGWAIVNNLWQMALLWILYHLITLFAGSSKSSLKTSLATLFLITGFALFIYSFVSFYNNESSQAFLYSSFSLLDGFRKPYEWLQQVMSIASILYLVLLFFPVAH